MNFNCLFCGNTLSLHMYKHVSCWNHSKQITYVLHEQSEQDIVCRYDFSISDIKYEFIIDLLYKNTFIIELSTENSELKVNDVLVIGPEEIEEKFAILMNFA